MTERSKTPFTDAVLAFQETIALEQLVIKAVAAEREACAAIVESQGCCRDECCGPGQKGCCEVCAAVHAIRSRSKENHDVVSGT